jgi:hypothetical protein
MNKRHYALLRSGSIVEVSLITERGFWIFKRYLVAFTTQHMGSEAYYSDLLGTTLPAVKEYTTRDTEWVKIVGEIIGQNKKDKEKTR